MTNVVNNFGFMAHIRASLHLFEEFSRGKARTETVLQAMDDGDTILCMGETCARGIVHRLKELGKHDARAISFERKDFMGAGISHAIERALRRGRGKVHVDHTFVLALIESQLDETDHFFGGFVGRIGRHNLEVIEQAEYDRKRNVTMNEPPLPRR